MIDLSNALLFQWLPSGDAFRISDLHRLENETLPTFFRHNRFQSLVRQLNFYNFRKVNRERTFWVYRHPLFHRDRPCELYLLRRRTCPGVDGRKNRSDSDAKRNNSPPVHFKKRGDIDNPTSQKDGNHESASPSIEDEKLIKRKKRQTEKKWKKMKAEAALQRTTFEAPQSVKNSPALALSLLKEETKTNPWNGNSDDRMNNLGSAEYVDSYSPSHSEDETKKPTAFTYSKDLTKQDDNSDNNSDTQQGGRVSLGDDCVQGIHSYPADSTNVTKHPFFPSSYNNGSTNENVDNKEHTNLVNKVSRQLEAHARRHAAMAPPRARRGRRRAGTVTPPRSFESDTMRYHALTYDDEIVNSRLHKRQSPKKTEKRGSDGITIVTDGDESDDDESNFVKSMSNYSKSLTLRSFGKSAGKHKLKLPPIADTKLITDIVSKLQKIVSLNAFTSVDDCQLTAAVSGFCMSTSPHDKEIVEKVLKLMSMCHPLAREFYKYRCALDPTLSSGLPIDFNNQSVLVEGLFKRNSDSNESVRGFKIFVFNYLRNLVDMVDAAANSYLLDHEAQSLSLSLNMWFHGVRGYQ